MSTRQRKRERERETERERQRERQGGRETERENDKATGQRHWIQGPHLWETICQNAFAFKMVPR